MYHKLLCTNSNNINIVLAVYINTYLHLTLVYLTLVVTVCINFFITVTQQASFVIHSAHLYGKCFSQI